MTRCIGSKQVARSFWAAVCSVSLLLPAPVFADVGEWSSGGPPEGVTAVALHATDEQELLAAGSTSVWRSLDGGGSWAGLAGVPLNGSLAYSRTAPATAFAVSGDRLRVMKSTDGGATWTAVFSGAQPAQLREVLPDPNTPGLVLAAGTAQDGLAQLWRSTDGGGTWNPALGPNQRGAGGIGQTAVTSLAALPGVPNLHFAGLQVYHGGSVLKSVDGGATWTTAYGGQLTPLAAPFALAAAGTAPGSVAVYASFAVTGAGNLVRSDDGGGTWAKVDGGAPPVDGPWLATALTTNPVQPAWLYAAVSSSNGVSAEPSGVFASPDRGQSWQRAGSTTPAVAGNQALRLDVPSRTLYAGGTTDPAHGVQQLTIAWPPIAPFVAHYADHDGLRLLGTGISLEADSGGHTSQYFEKGRLEDHAGESADPNWQLMYGLLVDELQTGNAPLPVGGDVSALTYADLNALASPGNRVPPPADYSGSGTQQLADGSVFVPFTADLSGAPGQLVPGYFWEYVNRAELFPGGWVHDVGLPITPTQQVQVTKYLPDGPAQRTIWVQAFQRTILTQDPENPPDWEVERANVGSDYRKQFSDRVGP
jgi:photosystem II stability/assembly factor-like uncharacterized protein